MLEWIGKPYQTQRLSREERAMPAFKAINPAGAVPVLEVDGWVLTQNAAILNYLADTYQEANGLLYADRTPKFPLEAIAAATRANQPEETPQGETPRTERSEAPR